MKKLCMSALLLCSYTVLYSQEVLWQKDIKSSTQDFLSQVITTIDQQYLILGTSIQPSKISEVNKRNTGYDYHVVKLDQQGNEIWEKYFSGQNHDYLSSGVNTQEGGFILAGTSYSDKSNDKKEISKGGSDIWLIRLNEFGDEVWQKTLGTACDDESRSIIQTTDLGFVVAGNVQHDINAFGSKDILITKLDKDGNLLYETLIGGKSWDEVEKILPTKDGGAILGIYSRSTHFTDRRKADLLKQSISPNSKAVITSKTYYAKSTENFGEGDYWIVKLNKDGKVEWEKNYGGKGDDHVKTLASTSTGYVVGGTSQSERSGNKKVGIEEGTDVWILSLNENGDEIWQRSYNFKNRDVIMGMNVIGKKNTNLTKGILLGGYTQAQGKIENNDETFWMLYIDSAGEEQWRKYVKGQSKNKEERLSDLKLNKDGSIILAGTSAEELGKENWKIVKLKDQQIEDLIETHNIKIYPNPASEYVYVEIGFDFTDAEILLYDMGGRQILSQKTNNKITKLNTQVLIQGAYLVVIKTNENKTANTKLIKK